MSYLIEAWLEEGQPCLKIINAETGKLRLHWQCQRLLSRPEDNSVQDDSDAKINLQGLFRNLFLMLAADRVTDNAVRLPLTYEFAKRIL